MIAETFINVLAGVASFILDLFPDAPDGEQAVGAFSSGIATIFGFAFGFGHWIPWSMVAPVLLLLTGALVAAAGIKAVRIIASFVTLGGGSAA